MNYVVCLTGGSKPLTPELVTEYFELDGSQVIWAKPAAKRNKVGDVAGFHSRVPDPNTPPGQPMKLKSYGRKVGFGGAIIPAEYLAFALEHGRFPKGKLVHKDGDRENNAPDNLVEIG